MPDRLQELLFDDIPYLKVAEQEHDYFAKVLRDNGVDVVYLEDLMSEVLEDNPELIEKFIDQLTPNSEVDDAWRVYVNNEKRRQFDTIVEEENLKREQAVEFIENAFERGYVPEGGMELDGIMPPMNPFDANANREGKIATVLEKLKNFFRRFANISDKSFNNDTMPEIKIEIHNHFEGTIDKLNINTE